MEESCSHLVAAAARKTGVKPSGPGCQECLQMGGDWVHLRLCLTCGHVGCCDNSPHRHATAHAHHTHHPVIRSYEPGEEWAYCYPDEAAVESLPEMPGEATSKHFHPPRG